MRLQSVMVVNLQSWKGKHEISFKDTSLNILRAPSETGKSVPSRFLVKFCNQNVTMEAFHEAFVRKGSKYGGLILKYDELSVRLFINKEMRLLCKVYEDGTEEVFIDNDITEEVLRSVGIIADLKNNLVVNVFSRDAKMLFVDTTQQCSGAILQRVLTDKEVEKVEEYLMNMEVGLKGTLKEFKPKKDILEVRKCNTSYVDIDLYKERLQSFNSLVKEVECIELLEELSTKALKSLKELELINYNEEKSNKITEVYSEYKNVVALNRIVKKYVPKPVKTKLQDVMLTDKIKEVKSVDKISYILKSISELSSSFIKPKEIDTDKLMSEKANLNDIMSIKNKCMDLLKVEKSVTYSKEIMEKTTKELEDLKREVGICPICGNKL